MQTETFENLVDTFEFLDDWEDRYRHVIELGKSMPPLDEGLKGPETKVDGCASQVWLVPEIQDDQGTSAVTFRGDSDAMIVRGLIAILITLFSGKQASEISKIDAKTEFARLGLDQHLSAQRSNGLKAMIARVQAIAEAVQR
ncbi:MAG: SufE family protein [Pseudomonadota bacterium]